MLHQTSQIRERIHDIIRTSQGILILNKQQIDDLVEILNIKHKQNQPISDSLIKEHTLLLMQRLVRSRATPEKERRLLKSKILLYLQTYKIHHIIPAQKIND